MSYLESLSESEEASLIEEATQSNGVMDTSEAPNNQKKMLLPRTPPCWIITQ